MGQTCLTMQHLNFGLSLKKKNLNFGQI